MGTGSTVAGVAEAMEGRDFDALEALLAPDVVLRSPITDAYVFHGRERVIELLRLVRDAYEELHYISLIESGEEGVQFFEARVSGRRMQGADLMRMDADGRVVEFTVAFRPLPGVATLAEALATRVAGRRGGAWAFTARLLVRPLVLFTRLDDRVAGWMLRQVFGRD